MITIEFTIIGVAAVVLVMMLLSSVRDHLVRKADQTTINVCQECLVRRPVKGSDLCADCQVEIESIHNGGMA